MVKLRRAVLSDAARLVEIYGYYVEKTAISFEYTVPSLEEFRGRMERIMRRYPYLVAEVDGRVAGYAYAGAFVSPQATYSSAGVSRSASTPTDPKTQNTVSTTQAANSTPQNTLLRYSRFFPFFIVSTSI